jgi:hypothetical protein
MIRQVSFSSFILNSWHRVAIEGIGREWGTTVLCLSEAGVTNSQLQCGHSEKTVALLPHRVAKLSVCRLDSYREYMSEMTYCQIESRRQYRTASEN